MQLQQNMHFAIVVIGDSVKGVITVPTILISMWSFHRRASEDETDGNGDDVLRASCLCEKPEPRARVRSG